MRNTTLGVALLGCLVAACSLEPPNAQMACASEEDCPPGWVCAGVCYRSTDDLPSTSTDSASQTSSQDTSDTETETDGSDCLAAKANDERLVCCPASFPTTCDSGDWAFSSGGDYASIVGCCSQDLGVSVACSSSAEWSPRTCSSPCAVVNNRMTCDGPKNNRCKSPVVIEPLPATWYGLWSDFDSTFTPVNDCGSGSVDIWFQVRLSGSGSLTVSSPDLANVRQILSCSDSSCLAWVYTPDNALHITGAPGDVVIVVASRTSTEERALALTFTP